MSGPDTRPGEISRIAASEIDFRVSVLSSQARMEAKLDAHMEDDKRQFAALNDKYGTVSSGVNDYREDKQQIVGARKIVTGTVLVIAALYGAAMGVIEIVRLAVKP